MIIYSAVPATADEMVKLQTKIFRRLGNVAVGADVCTNDEKYRQHNMILV